MFGTWASPLLLLLVLASGIASFSVPVADNDLWGHVAFGREILERGSLPERNLYSYTAPDAPWINHEILAECAFAWVFDRWGGAGLILLKTLLGLSALAFMIVSARRRTNEPVAWGGALLLAISLMSWGYLVRPQIFTFLGLAILWEILQRADAGQERWLWTIPVLFATWINAHGGVLAGAGIVAFFVLLRLPAAGAAGRRRLLLVGVMSALALLANPYGVSLVVFLVRDVLRDRLISEWAPVALFDLSNLQFKALLLISLAGWMRGPRKPWEAAILIVAALGAFRHVRHLPLFAIVATPFVASTLGTLIRSIRDHRGLERVSRGATATLAGAVVIVVGIQLTATVRLHQRTAFGIYVAPEMFPIVAVRFMRENGLTGNLAVPFDWGEYAIWHLYPSCRVSIDGRYTTAYPDDVIESAWRYLDGRPGWDRTLRDATLALADRRHATAALLTASPDWELVHEDPTALLFARRGADLPELRVPPNPQVNVVFP